MRSNSNNSSMGMPWLLAESLRSQIYTIQAPLLARTNLTSLIYGITSSIIEADSVKVTPTDVNKIDDIESNIDGLRVAYEPIMDNPESIEATSKKRTDYEQLLDITTKQLMYIIHKYGLVQASMMQPVEVKKWDEFK